VVSTSFGSSFTGTVVFFCAKIEIDNASSSMLNTSRTDFIKIVLVMSIERYLKS
jgi:hypothetical protein